MYYYDRKLIAGESEKGKNFSVDYFLTLFQDIAGDHGKLMGVGLEHIRKNYNAFWVVTKTVLEIKKKVNFGEEILLKTFPSKVKPLRVSRDYVIENSAKEECVVSRSEWCVLDTETKAIRKISSINHPEIDKFYGDTGLEFTRFDEINEQSAKISEVIVSKNDIDVNNHTNNVAYALMTMNCFSESERENLDIKNFEIHFIAQSYLGDKITIYKFCLGEKEYHFIGKIGGKKIFEVKLTEY